MLFHWQQPENAVLDAPPEILGRLARERPVGGLPGQFAILASAQTPGVVGRHGPVHDGCNRLAELGAVHEYPQLGIEVP